MKRLLIIASGCLGGLALTWICLYVFSRLDWPETWPTARDKKIGCWGLEHCANPPATVYVYLALFLLGPAIYFSTINGLAYRNWPLKKWAWSAGIGALLAIAFYYLSYAWPGVIAYLTNALSL
ncbi:hypothetical protein [Cupriavidus sp. U2]|uniref:hypothetical protein n=1 Tax=Cupriavidus sp. U2 TaxID=2920269 RepID=UPI00129EF805|nr:hypothetical protein [Cupriavidus sp. U2]